MTSQYLRRASLIVASNTGPGIDLSELRFRFETRQTDIQTPNACLIRVFNLSLATGKRILSPAGNGPEFNRVILQAGYRDGNFGIIFDGEIKEVRRGRLNATDTFLDIFAADGDFAYNWGLVNQSIAAGSTGKQRLDAMVTGFRNASPGINVSYAPNVPLGPVLPRGKVLFGLARDSMRDFAATADMSWNIQDGKITLVPQTSYLPGEAVVLTSDSGMIGVPEQTDNGIRVTCLLNPKLRIGGLVRINNADITPALINIQYTAINNFASISNDGFYKILVAEHVGDTRANPWYSELTCLAVDPSAAPADSVNPFGG